MICELTAWVDAIAERIPGRIGSFVRRSWYGLRFKSLGPGAYFDRGIRLAGASNVSVGSKFGMLSGGSLYANDGGTISIGDRVSVNFGVHINAAEGGTVVIGDDCLIAQNCVLRASNHKFDDVSKPINLQGHEAGKIVLEADVWLGAGVVVVPGVTIGRGTVVGAGAVVTKDLPPMSVAAGVPAVVVRKRGER